MYNNFKKVKIEIKTEQFASVLMELLGAMPPKSDFCKIIVSLAESSSWEDDMVAGNTDNWKKDYEALTAELKGKFGEEIDLQEINKEWDKNI